MSEVLGLLMVWLLGWRNRGPPGSKPRRRARKRHRWEGPP